MIHTISVRLISPLCLLAAAFSLAAEPAIDSPGASEPKTPLAIYGQGVRETAWQSPADELAGFHLPPGFEARLFVAEPEITKPLNMAFDDRGRMWVTQSVEYPYPAKEGSTPRDAVVILQDTDGDGVCDDITTFADELNIPIGVLPYGDGCICFSVPNLYSLRDTDGDGRCDRREVILGPFDTSRDAHGMINSLRDGGDGWIYACHGFNNQSEVAGTDGHVVTMHSGNTFRFRPDGSRIEHVTYGQVNPFGMTEDGWGYRYTADCHSKPITQLIFGACYPSFGRPHDGLGFLPPMVEHLHGSTAICGILHYPDHSPIVPLRGQMLSGNVMTSRINRNRMTYNGATAQGIEVSDFMTSDDPWFRPVDLRLGPDGHLYVADFYNKIIGHYEVPLTHPDRDRRSGRIWQIRYSGADDPQPATPDRLTRDKQRIAQLQRAFVSGPIDTESIEALKTETSDHVRVAAMRLAGELVARDETQRGVATDLARAALADDNAHLVQASSELLGRHGSTSDVRLLLDRLADVAPSDTVLRQTLRIAIRNLLQSASADDPIWALATNEQLASILLGLHRSESATLLLRYLADNPTSKNQEACLAHATRYASADSIESCVNVARKITRGNAKQQLDLINVLIDSQSSRPVRLDASLRQWALDLVAGNLGKINDQDHLLGWATDTGGVWPVEPRQRQGGGTTLLTSSLGRGESYTGRRVSDAFPAPNEISFWLAGHNGFPDEPDHGRNRVRLIRVSNGEVLQEATPPRNDVARQVTWHTADLNGDQVRIECIDGDSAGAFAWLAIGRFQPTWLDQSDRAESLVDALSLIRRLRLLEMEPVLRDLLGGQRLAQSLKLQVAQTVAALRNNKQVEVLLRASLSSGAPPELTDLIVAEVFSLNSDTFLEPAKQLCKRLSQPEQDQFAVEWSKGGADLQTLIDFAKRGWISPSVFVSADVAQAIEPRLSEDQQAQIESLTADLDVNSANSALLEQLQASIHAEGADAIRGQALYTKHCGNCHQLRGQGAVVGPQLDGAATRSIERLLEDIITPDRNVDQAFRTTSFLMDDGRVITGLITAESKQEILVVEPNGMAIRIDPSTVEQRREAGRSLMPSNMGEVLSTDELRDLVNFVKGTP